MELEPMQLCPSDGRTEDRLQTGPSGDETTNKRQSWSSQLDFIMASVGYAVGLGNVWRFPYLCYRNGGGIGYASQVIMVYTNVYYIIIIAWAIYYIAVSFTGELPWATCGNTWNTKRCHVTGMALNRTAMANCSAINCTDANLTSTKPVDAVVEYWEKGVLRMSGGIGNPGGIVPGLAVALLVAWVFVFLCICRGVKWTGKIVYFTAIFPYVLLTIILVRGITLKGSLDGIIYYLKPDFTRLADAQVWIEGGTQVLYSIGIAQGFMVTLGGYNKFNASCVRNSLIIITINCLTSLYGGLVVFSILGFMAHELGQSIHSVVDSGPGLVFLTYPKAVAQMPLSSLWSVLFFLTIFFVGLDSQFVGVESFLTLIVDRFPKYFYKTNNRIILSGVYCSVCFILGLPMVTEGGVYVFRLIDYYCVSGLVLLTTCTYEAIAIGWFFGADRFYDALEMMTGRRYSAWLKVCWKYIAPLIAQAIFWFEVFSFRPLVFDTTYLYPQWATVLGLLFMLSSTICIPITMIVYLCRANGTIKQRWTKITTPLLEKHQVHPKWAEQGKTWTMKYSRN